MKGDAGVSGRVSRLLVVCLLAIVAFGCGEPQPAPESISASVRDSAGVRIVEIPAASFEEAPRWTVSDSPLAEIGRVSGEAAQQLHRVRDLLRLPDGRIAVANGSPPEIRVFDESGRHVATLGREGEGPGELRSIDGLAAPGGDTLVVLDARQGRITRFTVAGGYVDERRVPPIATTERGERSPSGTWFLRSWPHPPGGRPERTGPVLFQSALLRLDPGATTPDTLRALHGPWMVVTETGSRWRAQESPHGHDSYFAVAGDRVWVGDSRRFELLRLETDGTPDRILRVGRAPRTATDRVLDSLARAGAGAARARSPAEREELVERLRDRAVPEILPAFQGLAADRAGRLWIGHLQASGLAESRWTALAADGRVLGRVHLPPRFRPHQFGKDWILGTTRDELGVERVRLYRMRAASR